MTDEIVKVTNSIVMPAVSSKEAVTAWKQYEDMKKAIITKSDIQKIGDKDYLKKSYWRKIATFFNLSVEVVSEKEEQIGKTIVWHFTCKAIAPNGRFAVGTGSCDAFEKATFKDGKYITWNKFKKIWEDASPNSLHNIRSTAETRATNRAISNLVGGGEVSAEEVEQGQVVEEKVLAPKETPKTTITTATVENLGTCDVHNVLWEKHGEFISHSNPDGTWCNKKSAVKKTVKK